MDTYTYIYMAHNMVWKTAHSKLAPKEIRMEKILHFIWSCPLVPEEYSLKNKDLLFISWWFKHNLLTHQTRWWLCTTPMNCPDYATLSTVTRWTVLNVTSHGIKYPHFSVPLNQTPVFAEPTFKRWRKPKSSW